MSRTSYGVDLRQVDDFGDADYEEEVQPVGFVTRYVEGNELAADDDRDESAIDRRERLKEEAILVPSSGGCMRIFLIVAAVLLFVSGIVLIIVGAQVNDSTLHVTSVTLFRTGTPATSRHIDALPAPVLKSLNTINLTIIFGIAQLAAGVGMLVYYFLYEAMLGEVKYGSNGYLWLGAIISLVLLDVVVALMCGLLTLTELIFDGMLHFSILALFWLGDLLNQRFYRNTMRELGIGRFSYAFLALAALIFIAVWGMQFVDLGFMVSGANGAPLVNITVPIVAAALELALFIVAGLHYGGITYFRETMARDTAAIIIIFITVLVVPILATILFASTRFIGT